MKKRTRIFKLKELSSFVFPFSFFVNFVLFVIFVSVFLRETGGEP